MNDHNPPKPPGDDGDWTLLQSRLDRTFWQWDRAAAIGGPLTRFVILRPPERLDYDDFDEAESMFVAMGDD